MPYLEGHWLAERLGYLGRSLTTGTVWGLKVRGAFLRLRSNPEAEDRSSASAAGLYETFLGPVTFLGLVRSCIEG